MIDYETSQDAIIQQEIEKLLSQKQEVDNKIKVEYSEIEELNTKIRAIQVIINKHRRIIEKYNQETAPITKQISTLQLAKCVHSATKENTLSIQDIDKKDYTTNIIDNFQRHGRYKYLIIENAFLRWDVAKRQTYKIDLILAKIPFNVVLLSTPKGNPTMTDIKEGKLTSVRVGDEKAEAEIKRFTNIMQQILLTPIEEYQDGKRFPFQKPCLFLAQDSAYHERGGWHCHKYAIIGIEVHATSKRKPYRSCTD